MRDAVDHRHAVGGPERDKDGLAILRHVDADGLDRLAAQAGDREGDLLRHGVLDRIDDADRAADFRRYPQLGPVVLERRKARPRIHQHVGDDLARRGVDEVRHVGGLGGIDQNLAVRTDGHAFGLDTDLYVTDARALFEVDDRDRIVVLIGNVKDLAGGILYEQFRVGAGGQAVDHLLARGINHLNGVVVADRDHHELAVPGELDAARP